jgi:hypothetical protein
LPPYEASRDHASGDLAPCQILVDLPDAAAGLLKAEVVADRLPVDHLGAVLQIEAILTTVAQNRHSSYSL